MLLIYIVNMNAIKSQEITIILIAKQRELRVVGLAHSLLEQNLLQPEQFIARHLHPMHKPRVR